MSSEDVFDLSEEKEASEVFRSSKRVKYVVDKWITPLYFDLLERKITVAIAAQHKARVIEALRDCELKLLALKYHFDNMLRFNSEFATEDRRILELNKWTEQKSISLPIDFELEAFLLQARSCLEVFCQIVASRLEKFRVAPRRVKNVLASRREKFAPKVKDHIESHPFVWKYLQGEEQPSLRDWIAHYGALKLTGLHTTAGERGVSYHGPLLSEVFPMEASFFAGAILHELEHMIKDCLAEIFERPPPGEGDFLISNEEVMRLGRSDPETPEAIEKHG